MVISYRCGLYGNGIISFLHSSGVYIVVLVVYRNGLTMRERPTRQKKRFPDGELCCYYVPNLEGLRLPVLQKIKISSNFL